MKPTATACHSGTRGKRCPSTSRRISCQRTVRSGKVSVAVRTVATSNSGSAARMWPRTTAKLTSRSVHHSSRPVTATPNTHAPRQLRGLGAGGGGLESELNEVADFFDEGAQLIARGALGGAAQLLRARQRAVAAIEQRADIHHR